MRCQSWRRDLGPAFRRSTTIDFTSVGPSSCCTRDEDQRPRAFDFARPRGIGRADRQDRVGKRRRRRARDGRTDGEPPDEGDFFRCERRTRQQCRQHQRGQCAEALHAAKVYHRARCRSCSPRPRRAGPNCCAPQAFPSSSIRPTSTSRCCRARRPRRTCAAWRAPRRRPAPAGIRAETVLGADTVVVVDGRILGKPRDAADAAAMLTALSGRVHHVYTASPWPEGGVGTRCGGRLRRDLRADAARRDCRLRRLGEPHDKAGAYAIQGWASRFIERLEGSYSGVIGLPVAVVHRLLISLSPDP